MPAPSFPRPKGYTSSEQFELFDRYFDSTVEVIPRPDLGGTLIKPIVRRRREAQVGEITVSIDEARRRLGYSTPHQIYRMIEAGLLEAKQPAPRRRYRVIEESLRDLENRRA